MVLTELDSLSRVEERVKRSARNVYSEGLHRLTFQAMSTNCQVLCRCSDQSAVRDLFASVLSWVAQFEARYSRFIPDSIIGRINEAAGLHWVEIDPDTETLLNLCHQMNFFSRGAFDPTVLPLLRLWNWKAAQPVVPRDEAIEATRKIVGWRQVQRRSGAVFLPEPGMCLDLGGIGKEHAVDCVLTMARQRGINHVLVDFGQDVRVHGQPSEKHAWHVGLEDPKRPGHCWVGVAVTNHAVATSGDYTRHFVRDGRRYGHIIDPRTGYPVNNGILSVSVIAPQCTLAGILSTSAFILGAEAGLNLMSFYPGAEGCITTENNRWQTPKFYVHTTS